MSESETPTEELIILSPEDAAAINSIVEHATAHPFDKPMMEQLIAGTRKPAGETPGYVCVVGTPIQFRCVYSHEVTKDNKPTAHLSVSVINPSPDVGELYPSPIFITLLMDAFGFVKSLDTLMQLELVYSDNNDITNAVHVVEPLELRNMH